MGWIEFTLPAKGRIGRRRRAAAVKAISTRDLARLAAFQTPAGPVRLNVVGGLYDNADGTSRMDEAAKLRAGDPVTLVREPDNQFDPSAVAVVSERGVQIGYLGEQRAAWIGSKIDKGMVRGARIDRLIGPRGGPRKPVVLIDLAPA